MAKDESVLRPFFNGFWTWDDSVNSLAFISRDKDLDAGRSSIVAATQARNDMLKNINFKNAIDELGQAQFRRLYQRRIKPTEPQIVTIQDIKDVALFLAERKDLTPEFVNFMHTRKMDEFLRSLIVYFQYYFVVWDNIILRREESSRKLRQPIVTVYENIVRDDLADLRSMVAKYYSYIMMGFGDSQKFYHMSNKNNVSLSDKDRHLHECVLSMTAKIIWIALLRKNFTLIEVELNRLFRSQTFNIMARLRQLAFQPNVEEDRVLLGKAHEVEKKSRQKSAAVQELVFDDHNYKMLAIGQLRPEPFGERMTYLEAAYTAPEEILFEIKVGVGILGLDKSYLNPILMPKEGMAKRIHIAEFKIPVYESGGDANVGETLPEIPPKYTESEQSRRDRLNQCKIWMNYVMGIKHEETISTKSAESSSTNTSEILAEEIQSNV